MRFWVLAFGATAVAGACVFLACGDSAFETSTDGGSGDANAVDVEADDVGRADAAPLDDASDACGPSAILCDNFDESSTLAGWWANDVACTMPSIASDTFLTSPHSLIASTDGADASCGYLHSDLQGPKHFICSFDVLLNEVSPDYMEYVTLVFASTSLDSYHVTLAYDESAAPQPAKITEAATFLDGGVANGGHPIPATFDERVWTPVALEINLNTMVATATVNGVQLLKPLAYAPSLATLTDVTIRLGPSHAGPVNMRAHYDNVVCNGLP